MQRVSPKLFIRTSIPFGYWSFKISVFRYWITVSRCWLLWWRWWRGRWRRSWRLTRWHSRNHKCYISLTFCKQLSCHFWWDVDSDRFSSAIHRRVSPMKALREFNRNTTLTNKSNCLTKIVASLIVRTSPLAVITVVGLFDVFMVSSSAEWRSFSLTICILAQESTFTSLSLWLSCWGTGENPLFCGREGCSSVVRFEFVKNFGKIPSLA